MQLTMFSDLPSPDRRPRLLTPSELGLICKLQREWRGWSQETLAELSGLTVRTVQRVEAAQPVGLDTRRALARAWGAPDIDCLNKPTVFPTMEEVQEQEKQRQEALARDYHAVDVSPTDGRGIARALTTSEAIMTSLADGLEKNKAAEDEFARISDYVRDLMDVASEVPTTDLLSHGDEMQGMVAELGKRGVTVMMGSARIPVRFGAGAAKGQPMLWTILYVFGARKGHEPKTVHVDKRAPMRL